MKRITVGMLEACDACEEQVDEFARRFPDGVTFESEADAIAQCVAVANIFDWDWASDNLLAIPARETCEAEVATAWGAYKAAKATAQDAYEAEVATAWEAYKAAKATAWKAYKATTTPMLEATKAAITTAQEAYEAAAASAFASAFYNQEG